MKRFLILMATALFACNNEQGNTNNSESPTSDTIAHNYIETPVEKGYLIFKANCAMCHTMGTEKIVGPGLQGITNRVPQPFTPWLQKYIKNNTKIIKSGDVYAKKVFESNHRIVMPTYDSVLTDDQINDLIVFLLNPPKRPMQY